MSKMSVYTNETKWTLPNNKKNRQICPSMTWALLNDKAGKKWLWTPKGGKMVTLGARMSMHDNSERQN